MRRRTGGPGSSAKSSLFSEEKPHCFALSFSAFGPKADLAALAKQPTRRPHDRPPRCLTAHHPAGTSRMGSDQAGPRDPELRAQGVEGLRVVHASAMPDLVSVHINACPMMGSAFGSGANGLGTFIPVLEQRNVAVGIGVFD